MIMYVIECHEYAREQLKDILGKEIKCVLHWDKWNDSLLIEVRE